jgi:putative flippase GtrA
VNRDLARQALRFTIVGASCFLLSLGTYILLLDAGLAYPVAGTVGYALGVVAGFVLNRRWTFEAGSNAAAGRQAARYLTVNAIALATNAGLLYVAVDLLAMPERVAGVAAMGVLAPSTFAANRMWSFRTVDCG